MQENKNDGKSFIQQFNLILTHINSNEMCFIFETILINKLFPERFCSKEMIVTHFCDFTVKTQK